MITKNSIENIKAVPLEKVIGHEIELTQKGSDYKGLCPFHKDGTPSLSVSVSKNVYKCFVCGEGGNSGVDFVMKHHNLTYPEAIAHIASAHKIVLEYDEKYQKRSPEEKDTETAAEKVLTAAQRLYRDEIQKGSMLQDFANERKLDVATLNYFGVGYAPGGNVIKHKLLPIGQISHGVKVGVLADGAKGSYDIQQERITFPIHDARHRLLGHGGRTTVGHAAKYVNSPETFLYSKSKTLYNLNRAIPEIKPNRTAVLVEGYMDVIAIHEIGVTNAVASCGTAFTEDQAKMLKRFADKLIVWMDGDEAGIEACIKASQTALIQGMSVQVISTIGQDPDEYRSTNNAMPKPVHFLDWYYKTLFEDIATYSFRAVSVSQALRNQYPKVGVWIEVAEGYIWKTNLDVEPLIPTGANYGATLEDRDADTLTDLRNQFLARLQLYPAMEQDRWLTKLSSKAYWGIAKNVIAKAMNSLEGLETPTDTIFAPDEIKKWPADIDTQFFLKHGFAPKKDSNGYYFLNAGGGYDEVGNFVLKPLFHIYGQDNKRYVEVSNKFKTSRILIDSKEMATVDRLHTALFNEGGFVAGTINKNQYMRLLEHWGNQFPKCFQLNSLGYQSEGFFAFSNKVYNGKLSDFDSLGIYKHKDTHFLSPSVVEGLLDIRDNEKETEYDEYLTYIHSPVSLEEYLQLYASVFKDHAVYGLAFIMMSIYRDICIKSNNIPLLYAHGPTSSGKSKFIETTMHFFFAGKNSENKKLAPYQLANGTEASLFQYMQRTANVMVAYNEVDIKSASEERILLFKGVYDGEGRSKMNGIKRNIITQHTRSCIALVGQFMYTGDDGSIVNRSIPAKFESREAQPFTTAEIENYKKLTDLTDKGVSSLVCDFLAHREDVLDTYGNQYNRQSKKLREECGAINSRLIDNYAHVITLYKVLGELVKLPFTYDYVWNKIMNDMQDQNEMVQDNGVVSQFWEVVDFMLQYKEISAGIEIAASGVSELRILGRRGNEDVKSFTKPTNVVFMNMRLLHMKYEINCRKRGTAPMSKSNLEKYIKDHPAFIGSLKNYSFSPEIRTSAYAFDPEKLTVDLLPILLAANKPQLQPDSPTRMTLYVCAAPTVSERAGVSTTKYKAERSIGVGQYERYNCITNADIIAHLSAQAKVDATGVTRERTFKNDKDEVVTFSEFLISEIHHIEAAPIKQSEIEFETEDKEPF